MSWGTLNVYYSKDQIRFKDNGSYESRSKSTIKMIQKAWELYKPSNIETKEILIHLEDGFSEKADFSYAITKPEQLHRCIPHFIFDSWPEIGIQDYESTFQQMIYAGNNNPIDSRVFWIGANTNPLRVSACKLANQYPNLMDFRMMSWNRKDPNALHKHTHEYVSLIDHCKYRVLIDLGAGGFSARLPLLFASGRPVILTDRIYETWFYWDNSLIPWVHYIPGGSTNESILKVVQWTFEHPDKAKEIGLHGQEYAKEHLSSSVVLFKCAKIIWNYK